MAEAATRFSSMENHGDLKKQSQYDRSAFGVQRAELDELKKQSQFAMNNIAASLYAEDGYGDISYGETGENKAKQTRSRLAPRPAPVVEKEESASAATG